MEEAGFLEAMKQDPENRELRQVYADWLDDQDDPRAEFIRLHHERELLRQRLEAIDTRIENLLARMDLEWVNTVFPIVIKSSQVGLFYATQEPNGPVYVRVGDTVEPDTVLGLVESLSVFNEIPAEVAGVVREIYVEDQDFVDYGQPLFRIDRVPPPVQVVWHE